VYFTQKIIPPAAGKREMVENVRDKGEKEKRKKEEISRENLS
jgi:hypothetical protein